jgi:hypothetical protein
LVLDPEESVVTKFLLTECVHSPFETDYILLSDLESAYESFCKNHLEQHGVAETLIGNSALTDFGTKLEGSVKVEYIKGIINGHKSKK